MLVPFKIFTFASQTPQLFKPTNGFQRLPRVFGVDVIDLSLQLQDLLGLDGDVCGLTLDTQHSDYYVLALTDLTTLLF